MPTKAYWDNQDRTIYCVELNADWTWEEFDQIIDDIYGMLDRYGKDVDFILCFNSDLPLGNAVVHLEKGGTQPPNIKRTVFVNHAGPLLNQFVRRADRQNGWDGPEFAPTIEDARKMLL